MEKRRIDRPIVRVITAAVVGVGLLAASQVALAKRPVIVVKPRPHRPARVVVSPRPHRPARVGVIRHLPRGHRRLVIGGHVYYVHRGVYYRAHGGGWVVVPSPGGVSLRVLPRGASLISVGGKKYHYHDGLYYLWHKGEYVAVRAPVGARVRWLPPGHTRVYRAGFEYYVFNGVHYTDGERFFVVADIR